jgi:cyclopropane-fatty-acyl-phospholipid synthase
MRSARSLPFAAHLLLGTMQRVSRGSLVVETPDRERIAFGERTADESAALIRVRDWRMARDTLRRGDVGFAESYIDGSWDTPDLARLLQVIAVNRRELERSLHAGGLSRWLLRLRHALHANTPAQARRNIAAHYDLGNAFYARWLDETMTYSSAWFGGDRAQSLADAQRAKYERVLAALALPRGAHILEIGCGWGGFAEAAARAGYRVTGLSLSEAQTAYARDRIARAGLSDRVTLRLQDYRDERGRYDGVASIEMIESVGERYWPRYFETLAGTLARGGRACLQAITIADERFARYRAGTDFIQQYIFPGGMLPSRSTIAASASAAGLRVADVCTFGHDYAETLTRWLSAFDGHAAEIRDMGFDDRFMRCWRFYLAYCIAGFSTESTDVGHFTLVHA